jgi:type IV fimbrial biogenesis protein FimT
MTNKPTMSLGVTLPELMTTVCITSILAFVAVPSFMELIMSNRTTAIANQLVTGLAYAKSEAIKRGQQVTIRHKGTTARVWEEGWDIFSDSNGDGATRCF